MANPVTVLVVEDEILLASDAEYLLEQAGLAPVGVALRSSEAIAMADSLKPALALVDLHLLDGPTGPDVARYLTEKLGIPVVFTTGNVSRVPEDFAGALGVIEKPYTENGFLAVMRYLKDFVQDRTVIQVRKPPAALMPSPHLIAVVGA